MSTPFKTIGLLARRRGTDIIDSVVAVEESLRELVTLPIGDGEDVGEVTRR